MVAVTYNIARASAAAAKSHTAPRKRWLTPFFEALMEARLRQAQRELARHADLLPYTLDSREDRLVTRSREKMPFRG